MATLMPIKQKRVSDQVFEQLRGLIFKGEIAPGEKLMTERELAAAMAVSRTSVRNAINRLASVGLLEQHQGRGTFVTSSDTKSAFLFSQAGEPETPSITDLLEVRMGLECYAASLAASRADHADIRAMDKSLADMEKAFASGQQGAHADVAFHMAVALAAKNPVHTFIINSFSNYLFHGNQQLLAHLYQEEKNTGKVLKQHQNIIRQIRHRNPDRAYAAMKTHIVFLSDFVKGMRPKPS
jgi:GntR family transcriptional repressor for pyruvate dehydrogenase complex